MIATDESPRTRGNAVVITVAIAASIGLGIGFGIDADFGAGAGTAHAATRSDEGGPEPEDPAAETTAGDGESVEIPVGDGGRLRGAFSPGAPGGSTIVVLTASADDRARVAPLDPALARAGFHRLRIDFEPGEPGADRFASRVRAVQSSIDWVEATRGADRTRVGLLATASTAPVAVSTAVRERAAIRAIALVSPSDPPPGTALEADLAGWDHLPTRVFENPAASPRSRLAVALAAFEGTEIVTAAETDEPGTAPRSKEAVADFFGGVLGEHVDLRVPCFAADDPAVATAGFVRRTLRPRRNVDGAVHELMTFGVGDRWTLGAMVRQPFEGTVAFLFGESGEAVREITVALRHPAPAADAGPRASVDGADIAGPLETTRGSAGPWGWVTVETDLRLLTEPDARDLVLEFRDPDGRVVARLPDATPDRAPAFRPVAVRHALPSSSPADEHP